MRRITEPRPLPAVSSKRRLALMVCAMLAPFTAQARDLVYLSSAVPAGLDVDGPSSSSVASQTGMVNLIEPLVYFKLIDEKDGVKHYDFAQFQGMAAESWSYDPAKFRWTFHLRHDVKSCAGNTLTADDVVYSLSRALSVSGAGPISWFPMSISNVVGFTSAVFGATPEALAARKMTDATIRKVDDYTVEITQSAPNQLFLSALTQFDMGIYDSKEMKAHATDADPWSHIYGNNVNAPGFGPYCLDHWVKDKEFVLSANANYHGGKPPIDKVSMLSVGQSSQRLVLLRSGDAQLVDKLTPREYASLQGTSGIHVVNVPSNSNTVMLANWTKQPWSNVKLREAIAAAIPYDSILKNVYLGQSARFDGVIPSSYPNRLTPQPGRPYDIAKAKQLLADAGFPGGKGLEAFASSLTLTYPTESESVLGPVATIIKSSLQTIGVPITLNPIPLTQLLDRALVKRDLEFTLIDFSKSIGLEAGFAIQLYFVTRDKGGVANYSLYSNPKVDDIFLNHAKNEPDPATRSALLKQIQQIAYDDVVIIPITENAEQWAMTSKLAGIGFAPDQATRFVDLHFAE